MATWKPSLSDEISATRAALRSRFTPDVLRPSLSLYLESLRSQARGAQVAEPILAVSMPELRAMQRRTLKLERRLRSAVSRRDFDGARRIFQAHLDETRLRLHRKLARLRRFGLRQKERGRRKKNAGSRTARSATK